MQLLKLMQPMNLQLLATTFVDSIDNSITEPIYNTMAILATLSQCQYLQFLYSHNLHSTCIIYRTQNIIYSLLCSTKYSGGATGYAGYAPAYPARSASIILIRNIYICICKKKKKKLTVPRSVDHAQAIMGKGHTGGPFDVAHRPHGESKCPIRQ
jgi:hypothetical protein